MSLLEEFGWTEDDAADAAKYGWKITTDTGNLAVAWPGEDFAADGKYFTILCNRTVQTPEYALCRVKLQWLRAMINDGLRRRLEERGFWE